MGDRALVTFKNTTNYSPTIYLHWAGSAVADWLKEAAPMLRKGDESYAAARFCGFCHEKTGRSTTGLGLLDAPSDANLADLNGWSHGDAGVFIVDINSGEVTAAGGYGKPFQIDPATFGT